MERAVVKRTTWLAAAILTLCAVRAAHALPPPPSFPICCACIPTINAQSSQLPTPVQAIFCVQAATEDQVGAADQRCGAASGDLECLAQEAQSAAGGAGSCVAQLAAIEITCPVPGAPTMGHTGLAALTALLVMLGVVLLRRRAARAS